MWLSRVVVLTGVDVDFDSPLDALRWNCSSLLLLSRSIKSASSEESWLKSIVRAVCCCCSFDVDGGAAGVA